jgi:predicted Zn-dependent protease
LFYLEKGQSLELAAEWAEQSVRMEPKHFYNRWILARVLKAQGKTGEAKRVLEDAYREGESNKAVESFFNRMRPEMDKARNNW